MVALASLVLLGGTAFADHQNGHNPPAGPAVARFPSGFRTPIDAEWRFKLGGFGGKLADDAEWGVKHRLRPERHYPVIFVHGNNVDAADWYPIRDSFINEGWNASDVWAVSYNGIGSQNGTGATANPRRDDEHLNDDRNDFIARITNNEKNRTDLRTFINEVRRYRKQPKFSIVAHSLGVTLVRNVLKRVPSLRKDLVSFVAIAGGNHGTSLCPPGSEGNLYSCDEVAKGTPWLARLNGRSGSDETYGPARWLTIYDGSGYHDVAFIGPDYAQSPHLRGAVNCQTQHDHNDLRMNPAIVEIYRRFIEGAERGVTLKTCPS